MYCLTCFAMYNETSTIPRYGLIDKLLREDVAEAQVASTEGQTSIISRLFNERCSSTTTIFGPVVCVCVASRWTSFSPHTSTQAYYTCAHHLVSASFAHIDFHKFSTSPLCNGSPRYAATSSSGSMAQRCTTGRSSNRSAC